MVRVHLTACGIQLFHGVGADGGRGRRWQLAVVAPILPHMAEDAYQNSHLKAAEGVDSVFKVSPSPSVCKELLSQHT